MDFAYFPLANPGIVSIPLAFVLGIVGTLSSPDRGDPARNAEMEVPLAPVSAPRRPSRTEFASRRKSFSASGTGPLRLLAENDAWVALRHRDPLPDGPAGLLVHRDRSAPRCRPMYSLYADRMHFAVLTTTVIFATYAIGVLFALPVFGRWSSRGASADAAAGAAAAIASAVVFLIAQSVPGSCSWAAAVGVVGRHLRERLTAAVIESALPAWRDRALRWRRWPTWGLGLGPLLAVLVQYAPMPYSCRSRCTSCWSWWRWWRSGWRVRRHNPGAHRLAPVGAAADPIECSSSPPPPRSRGSR
jgi:uncharacterized membrane protein